MPGASPQRRGRGLQQCSQSLRGVFRLVGNILLVQLCLPSDRLKGVDLSGLAFSAVQMYSAC